MAWKMTGKNSINETSLTTSIKGKMTFTASFADTPVSGTDGLYKYATVPAIGRLRLLWGN